MNSNIPFTLGNVAEIAISPINADATIKTSGNGNRMIFGGLVTSSVGRPFEVLRVNASNWSNVLGRPEHTSKGMHTESLRQLSEAVKGGEGLVVRVVGDDYRFPSLHLSIFDQERQIQVPMPPVTLPELEGDSEGADKPVTLPEKGAKTRSKQPETKPVRPEFTTQTITERVNLITPNSHAFGTDIETTSNTALIVWVTDGDPSSDRKLSILPADVAMYGAGMWEVLLVKVDSAGNETELESHIVSMDVDAIDDMGQPAFIETVLESRSSRLAAKIGAKIAEMPTVADAFTGQAFTGGQSGNMSLLTTENYQRGLSVLSSTIMSFNAVCGLGVYNDEIIRGLADLADSRRIRAFIDINPRLSFADALQKAADLALNRERVSLYHLPYSYTDGFYGNRTMAGISGVAFSAKARGVAKTAPVGGWHYTAAGEERAIISRSGLRLADGVGEPNYDQMYKSRINKVAANAAGMLFIDDSLTSYTRENYLRFEQVVDVADVISRDFHQLANQLKHSPDGVTFEGLVSGMTDILDGYVAIDALVKPRDPADGEQPYQLFIEQTEIDAWKCRWAICVSGSGRRFLGEPVLLR